MANSLDELKEALEKVDLNKVDVKTSSNLSTESVLDTKLQPLTTNQIVSLTTDQIASLTSYSFQNMNYGATGGKSTYSSTASGGGGGTGNIYGNLSGYHTTSSANMWANTTSQDMIIGGRSLSKVLEAIENRLGILDDPSPAKLEKHAALKKAYEHYKMLEKLIGED